MIEVCFTEEEFEYLDKIIIIAEVNFEAIDYTLFNGIKKSLETASKPMLYTSENKQRIKE